VSDDTRDPSAENHDDMSDVEQLIRELDDADLELTPPPADVWAGIDRAVRADTPAVVVPLQKQRKVRRGWLIAAAVVMALVAGAVIVSLTRGGGEDVVASAVLVHDASAFDPRGAGASATARLVEREGHYEIELSKADLPTIPGDDLELWLIEPDAQGKPMDIAPVSVIASSKRGVYSVPAGLDPSSHYVVDISIEPRDGIAAHSCQSILRGALQAT